MAHQDRRNRIVVMLTNFFLHLHPVSIKKQGIALSYTWCMGGVTFPRIGELPYLLTLPGHGFYWFLLPPVTQAR